MQILTFADIRRLFHQFSMTGNTPVSLKRLAAGLMDHCRMQDQRKERQISMQEIESKRFPHEEVPADSCGVGH